MSVFENLVLYNWGDVGVKANIDEQDDEIIAAILYDDHGDEFLSIKTSDGYFEYGYYLNRPWQPDFIREPTDKTAGKCNSYEFISGDHIQKVYWCGVLIDDPEVIKNLPGYKCDWDEEYGGDMFNFDMDGLVSESFLRVVLRTVKQIVVASRDLLRNEILKNRNIHKFMREMKRRSK